MTPFMLPPGAVAGAADLADGLAAVADSLRTAHAALSSHRAGEGSTAFVHGWEPVSASLLEATAFGHEAVGGVAAVLRDWSEQLADLDSAARAHARAADAAVARFDRAAHDPVLLTAEPPAAGAPGADAGAAARRVAVARAVAELVAAHEELARVADDARALAARHMDAGADAAEAVSAAASVGPFGIARPAAAMPVAAPPTACEGPGTGHPGADAPAAAHIPGGLDVRAAGGWRLTADAAADLLEAAQAQLPEDLGAWFTLTGPVPALPAHVGAAAPDREALPGPPADEPFPVAQLARVFVAALARTTPPAGRPVECRWT